MITTFMRLAFSGRYTSLADSTEPLKRTLFEKVPYPWMISTAQTFAFSNHVFSLLPVQRIHKRDYCKITITPNSHFLNGKLLFLAQSQNTQKSLLFAGAYLAHPRRFFNQSYQPDKLTPFMDGIRKKNHILPNEGILALSLSRIGIRGVCNGKSLQRLASKFQEPDPQIVEEFNTSVERFNMRHSYGLRRKLNSLQGNFLIPRQEPIAKIVSQFQSSTDNLPTQVIFGSRGSGKATLASSYALQYEKNYSRIYLIDAKTIDQDLAYFADGAGILSDIPLQDRLLSLKKWFEAKENYGWLWIVNDLDPDNVEVLKSVLPDSGGHLLITTYHQTVCDGWPSRLKIELPVFTPLEATQFLLQTTSPSDEEKKEVAPIASQLGYLPLALTYARAYVNNVGVSLTTYLEHYEKHRMKFLKIEEGKKGLLTSWSMNLEAVKSQNNLLVAELFPFFAYLYPHNISYSLIFKTWRALFQLNSTDISLNDALEKLKEFALIDGDKATFRIHPFLQEAIKDSLQPDEQKRCLHQVISVLINTIFVRDLHSGPTTDLLIPHCNHILENELSEEDAEWVSCIHQYIGDYFYSQSDFPRARIKNEEVLAIRRRIHQTDDHPSIAASLNNLGLVLQAQGDLRGAQVAYERALAIFRRIYQIADHPNIASALNNLGFILQTQGDSRRAQEKYEEALAIQRRIHQTDDHPEIANTLNNLGIIFQDQGDFAGAQAKYEEVLAIRRRIFQTDERLDIARSLNNLGSALQDQGDLQGARAKYEEGLAIQRRIYQTDEHPDIAKACNNLGILLQHQGDLVGAQERCEEALAILRNIYPTDDHPDIATTLDNLGHVLQVQGDLIGAERRFEETLAILRRIYKRAEHPKIASALNCLGVVLLGQGDLGGAQAKHEEALTILRIIHPTLEHLDIARTMSYLGLVLKARGDLQGARAKCEEVLVIGRRIYKTDEYPDKADFLNNLGTILLAQGDLRGAHGKFEEALAMLRKVLKTDEHPKIATILSNLGGVLKEEGDLRGAQAMFEEALAIRRRFHQTDEHSEIAGYLNNLGSVLQKEGDFVGARAKFEEALAIWRRIHQTDEHPDIAASHNNLGHLLFHQGDPTGARAKFEEALAIMRKIYQTDEHLDIGNCFNNLGSILYQEEDLVGAQNKFEKALAIFKRIFKTEELHSEMATSHNGLGLILCHQRDFTGAQARFEEALAILRKIHQTDEHPSVAIVLRNLKEVSSFLER